MRLYYTCVMQTTQELFCYFFDRMCNMSSYEFDPKKISLSNPEKLSAIVDRLPSFCYSFLLGTSLNLSTTTRIAYARDLEHFFRYLLRIHYFNSDYESPTELLISDLKTIDAVCISLYLSRYFDTGCTKKSVARKRSALSSFFNYMLLNKRIDYNPVNASTKVSIPSDDNLIYLTPKEQNILIDAISSGSALTKAQKPYHAKYILRDLSIVMLFLDTGMRVSELHGIDIKDVNLEDCSAVVTRKGGDVQTLYFADDTSKMIKKYVSSRKKKGKVSLSDPLFVTDKNKRLSIRAIQVMITKYASTALPQKRHISPHKMRSSFAMSYYAETKDILALQRKLNHRNLTTTNIYAKATDSTMRDTRSVVSDLRKREKGKERKSNRISENTET